MIFNFLKKEVNETQGAITVHTIETIQTFDKVVSESGKVASSFADPVRQKLLKRFPVLFLLLGAVGGTATFLGLEQVILQYDAFKEYPALLLVIGIIILVFTGKLYKKLE